MEAPQAGDSWRVKKKKEEKKVESKISLERDQWWAGSLLDCLLTKVTLQQRGSTG